MKQTTRMRALLAERDFRMLLGSQFLGQAADGVAQAVFAYVLVLEPLEGTPSRILTLFVVTLLPYSLISPFLGVFVDRWPRRQILVATNLARFALLVTIPLWDRWLRGDAALLVGMLVLLGLGRLFLTTKGAALPVVTHEHHLLRANAVSGGGGMIAALAGGVVGVAAVSLTRTADLGADAAFVFAGVVYGASALLARRISDPLAHRITTEAVGAAVGRVAHELVDGMRLVATTAAAALPLIGIFIVRILGMLTAIAAILFIKDAYPEAGDVFGRLSTSALALTTAGIGAFAGALSAPALGRRLEPPGLVMLGFAVSGVGVVALGGVVSLAALLLLMAIGGFGGFVAKVATDAQVQGALADEYRGRAFALYDILYNLASVVAGAVIVAFAGVTLRPLLIGAGAATLALAALLGSAMTRAGMRMR